MQAHKVARSCVQQLCPCLPFCAVQDGELQPNEFTWTSYANIIFLESPAFVGWSYSNNTQDLAVGESSQTCAIAGRGQYGPRHSLVQQLCCGCAMSMQETALWGVRCRAHELRLAC